MSQDNTKGGSLNFLWIMALIIALLSIVFTLQNYDKQTIQFFWMSIPDVPLALVIFSCLALGAVITLLFSISSALKRRKERQTLVNEINLLRKELKSQNKAIPRSHDAVE
jgi:uncharacterized integral membrane protein